MESPRQCFLSSWEAWIDVVVAVAAVDVDCLQTIDVAVLVPLSCPASLREKYHRTEHGHSPPPPFRRHRYYCW